MSRHNSREMHALFQSIGDDGITWQFIILADDRWSITRDDVPVDAGPADRRGIDRGVRQFLRLTGSESEKHVDPPRVLEPQK